MNFAIIVASARARSGKTLLARLLAEHFVLSGMQPAIFDTDAAAPLVARFPKDASALDIDRVTDQMALFDGLSAPAANSRIVDLSHRAFKKFFNLMLESDYIGEARANGLEPVVFFIGGTDQEAFEQAEELRYRIGDCPFVFIENAFLGEVKQSIRASEEFQALAQLPTGMLIPALDPFFMEVIEEPDVSLSEFMREPTLKMSAETRAEIRSWLMKGLGEIYRVLKTIERREHVRPVRR
ncbi:MAG TPA: hypothetical protein VJL90_07070 [Pseudorhodoplanes sp.]|nr:hypothetical protein [Pseudorhodoplanes sp.]